MKVETFVLCDAATVSGGKLNILGVFDTIWSKKTPNVHPQCAVALRIRFQRNEKGKHPVLVNFVDIDGKHIIPPANGNILVNCPENQNSKSTNVIFNIQGLKLEKYGEYSIDLAIDGRHEIALPLFVKEPDINR